jgi:hypothetical protein
MVKSRFKAKMKRSKSRAELWLNFLTYMTTPL